MKPAVERSFPGFHVAPQFLLSSGLLATSPTSCSLGESGRGELPKSLIGGHSQEFKGHHPAGGWMVIALIISPFITTLSGLKLYAVEEGLGPFAGNHTEIQLTSCAYADDDDTKHKHSRNESGDDSGNEFGEEL